MRSNRCGRAVSLALCLLTALVSSGCPELNTQPDYLGEKNSLMSIADPLPPDAGAKPGRFEHGSVVITQEGGTPGPGASSAVTRRGCPDSAR